MRLIAMRVFRRLAGEESGYAMAAVVGAVALISVLVGGALTATRSDVNLVRYDLDKKRAYAAAQAGIADYSFHLNNDNNYWAKCKSVPTPHAVNQVGSTLNRRAVPGDTTALYSIELLPAGWPGGSENDCETANPVRSMLEAGGINTGTFRIRATGYAGDTDASIVASYKRASLLDYIYFTQYETSDPVTYGYPNPSAALSGAISQCTKFIREGRYSQPMPNTGGQYCNRIFFVSDDDINGPLHTNDALQICGDPEFGRSASDVVEVSSPPPGWTGHCGSDDPDFNGPLVTTAPVLTPPPTNAKLKTLAGSYVYSGQTTIALSGANMTVTTSSGTVGPIPVPADGVVYVKNSATVPCSASYSPFTATYPTSSGCGTARVSGSYTSQLTIAAENDIIVWDDIHRSSGGMLGLVANNFIRIRHPFSDTNDTVRGQCDGGTNQSGTQTNLEIDAAILSIQHSFIVDHYDCGASLGELNIEGAISQKFRGPVGTTGGTGYLKDYNYDDRLRYQEPPHFLDPVESAWHIQRETLDFS